MLQERPMIRRHVAVVATVILNQALGYLWYSPVLFLSPRLRALGTDIDSAGRAFPLLLIVSIPVAIIAGYTLSLLARVFKVGTFKRGVGLGSFLWLCVAAPAFVIRGWSAGLPWMVTFIDASYVLVALALTGGLVVAWSPSPGGLGQSTPSDPSHAEVR
jgi:hypothetical protein